MANVELRPLPDGWNDSPKGCWSPHPETREICELPQDGHKVHARKHPNGTQLECWRELQSPKVKVIEAAWLDYLEKVIPPAASRVQVTESKKAFYAGAGCLLKSICNILGPGQDATESDLTIMDGIAEELRQFVLDMGQGRKA